MMKSKLVYDFKEGDGKNKQLLGGKGAGLSEMTQIGLPVPPGFVITTEACRQFYVKDRRLPAGLMSEVTEHMHRLEEETQKGFGSAENPLLVSVRSGAAMSMPGMMDTILNLGLNDQVVESLGQTTKNRRFAYDAYRRLIQLFGKIALEVDDTLFDKILEKTKEAVGTQLDTDLDTVSGAHLDAGAHGEPHLSLNVHAVACCDLGADVRPLAQAALAPRRGACARSDWWCPGRAGRRPGRAVGSAPTAPSSPGRPG